MRYCPNCGEIVGENKQFCHNCGEKQNPHTQYQPNQYQAQYQPNQSNTTYQASQPYQPTVSKKNAVIAFIFGLINIELFLFCIFPYACFLFFPACLVLSIIGIKKASQYNREAGKSHAFSKIGKILCIISLVLACIFFLIGLIMSFDATAAYEFYEVLFEAYGFDIDGLYSGSDYNDGYYNGGGYYTTIFNI